MIVAVKDVHEGDIVELENGSIYVTSSSIGADGTHRVRVLCAHPPDPITFDPPLVELPATQQVRLLSGGEADGHALHDGYVEHAFRAEMERRNAENMQLVGAKIQSKANEQQQRERAGRPWWRRLLPRRST